MYPQYSVSAADVRRHAAPTAPLGLAFARRFPTPDLARAASTCVVPCGPDRRAWCPDMRRTCRPARSQAYPASPCHGMHGWRPSAVVAIVVARLDGQARPVDLNAIDGNDPGAQRMSYFHERPSDDASRSSGDIAATSRRRRDDCSKRLRDSAAPRVVTAAIDRVDTGGTGGYGGIARVGLHARTYGATRRTYIHFMDDPPRLLCDADGRQLYVLGGSYRITQRGIEG